MKKALVLIFCIALSYAIVVFVPEYIQGFTGIKTDFTNEVSIIPQEVISTSKEENEYYKMYDKGQLIGVIKDKSVIDDAIKEEHEKYIEQFPDSTLGLKENIYLVNEKSYNIYENIDDKIIDYLTNNNCLGIKANCIEFSVEEGVYERIYVENIEDFYSARDSFLLNFVSSETLEALRKQEKIGEIQTFGTMDVNAKIEETITYSTQIVSPESIFTSVDEIYEFLCFGREKERQYYVVQEGDTLSGVGFRFGDLSADQLVMLNKDVLSSTDQVLPIGTVLNVTYFSSPINVIVTKQRLIQETIAPESQEYVEDNSLEQGTVEIEKNEVIGLENVLYEEVWRNGVIQSGEQISSTTVRQAERGIIRVGVGSSYRLGTGNFMFPTDNAYITCAWRCYFMNGKYHNGTDIANRYNRYGNIYAADSGTVEKVGYDSLSGNFLVINHNNGYKTYYGHMNTVPYVDIGDGVSRGQLIGQIGMTGYATGPHIHFMIYVDEVIVDACTIMDCSLIGG